MDPFITNSLQGLQLVTINQCRLFMQDIHLFDITSNDSYCIRHLIYRGENIKCLRTQYMWPEQGPPGTKNWID